MVLDHNWFELAQIIY